MAMFAPYLEMPQHFYDLPSPYSTPNLNHYNHNSIHVMRETDIERAAVPSPRDRAYGTITEPGEIRDLEKDIENRMRERENGALVGGIISTVLSLVVLSIFVVIMMARGPEMSVASGNDLN